MTPQPGTLIDDGDDHIGLVIDPDWTDDQIVAAWGRADYPDDPPTSGPFDRRRLHRHSARQLRADPQAYDDWWSTEGELKACITVAEVRAPDEVNEDET